MEKGEIAHTLFKRSVKLTEQMTKDWRYFVKLSSRQAINRTRLHSITKNTLKIDNMKYQFVFYSLLFLSTIYRLQINRELLPSVFQVSPNFVLYESFLRLFFFKKYGFIWPIDVVFRKECSSIFIGRSYSIYLVSLRGKQFPIKCVISSR